MRLRVADAASRSWISNLLYVLLEQEQYEFAFTFHNIDVIAVKQPFAHFNGLAVPAAVGMIDTFRIAMLLYYPIISRLSHRAQIAVLKHEALHVVEGHMSSYGMRLTDDYGPEVSNIAKDLYVNQRLSDEEIKSLQNDGLPPQIISDYGFPKDLSSEHYCDLLRDEVAKGNVQLPDGDTQLVPSDAVDGESGTEGTPGEPFDGQGKYRPSEVFDLSADEKSLADQATRSVIQSVTETLEARGEEWQASRGFGGADRAAFVEASKRTSRVPWHHYLRVMESRQRAERVVPTRSRLSRRCPSHMGRVRRYGLDVAFMVDTSGSMGAEQLRLVDAELRGMHTRGAHISVIHCDAEVAKVEDYSPFSALEQFHGRGGTDFSPTLLYVRDMYPRPSLFVGYTDGFGSIRSYVAAVAKERGEDWYEDFAARMPTTSPDGVETVWLIPEGCMEPDAFKERICSWGQVIVVPTDLKVQDKE